MDIPILYQDNHVLALNKPAGLLSQGDRTGDASVVSLIKAHLKEVCAKPGNVYLGLVHRLDRPVSGAMVVARTSKAARRLSAAFKGRAVKKQYLALVQGVLRGEGTCKDALLKERGTSRVVARATPSAKDAVLTWEALAHAKRTTLLRVVPVTGRPHQIRCQLASRGYPVVGDRRYGSHRSFDGRNLALHSFRLSVPHPVRGTLLTVTAPLPKSWAPWGSNRPVSL